jgi:hypothetical protein
MTLPSPACRVIAMAVLAAVAQAHPRETASCGSNIVSATVVATFCGHRAGDDEILDLFVLWRGRPGWFQRSDTGSRGGRGSRTFGAGTNGRVSQYESYGDVTVGFEADFDARTVTIAGERLALEAVNAVLVDHVDALDGPRVAATRQIAARLPLLGDTNLAIVRRSRELQRFLRCEIAMPVPRSARGPIPQPPVITVCEKLARK